MKHAKKMILISEEEYRELQKLKKSQEKVELKNKVKKVSSKKSPHNAVKQMSQIINEYKQLLEFKKSKGKVGELKNKIKKVLSEEPTHNAAKRMSQIVGEYLRYKQTQKTEQSESLDELKKKKKPNLLSFFSPTYHEKVKAVMLFLETHGVTLTDKMELILSNGNVIPNSNIIDLLKEALVITKRKERTTVPNGWAEFIQEIANSNVPLNLFTKRTTLGDIRQLRENQPWVNF